MVIFTRQHPARCSTRHAHHADRIKWAPHGTRRAAPAARRIVQLRPLGAPCRWRLFCPRPYPCPAPVATAHAAGRPPHTSRSPCSGRGRWRAGIWRAGGRCVVRLSPSDEPAAAATHAVRPRGGHRHKIPAWGFSFAGAGDRCRAAGRTPCTAAWWGAENCNPHWPAEPS